MAPTHEKSHNKLSDKEKQTGGRHSPDQPLMRLLCDFYE